MTAAATMGNAEAEQKKALLTVAQCWRQWLARALLAVVSGLHLWAAITLLLAPGTQLFTQGTQPMFALAPPPVWAVGFCVGGVAAGLLLGRVTGPRLWAAALTVFPVQAMWLGAAVVAVWLLDRGSAMSVVFLSGIVAFTCITFGFALVDYTSGKR